MVQPIENLQRLYVAKITKDDRDGIAFDKPRYLEGVRDLGIKPKTVDASYYHESKKVISKSIFSEADLEVDITDLSKEEYVINLGHKIGKDGGILKSADDIAPNQALMFECKKANGKSRFVVVYNCVFGISDESYKQMEGKVDYQSKKFKITAMPLKFNGAWQQVFDEEDGMTANKFFDAVPMPELKVTTP